jgi:GT2 family glycosyltransferase
LLNSDTQVKEGTLVKLVEFEKKVGPAIIGARFLNPDGSTQASVFHLPTIRRAICEFWLGKRDAFSKYAPAGERPVEVEAVSGGAMLISRGIIEKIGLFDERYFMYFEDLDYCRRAKLAGFKVYYLPSAEVIHEHGASGRKIADEANQWRRLIPSSKIYHGMLRHYLIYSIIWLGQRLRRFFRTPNSQNQPEN